MLNIINSDQGSHFTSPRFIETFEEKGVKISLDGRGRALDNVFTERLGVLYKNPREALPEINNYLNFYDNIRPHQSLNYKTPAEVYQLI